MQPIYSSSTILNCSGDIPKGAPCIIKASSYKVEVEKIDICKNNPFPNIRSTPDYAGSYCLNLFDKKNNSGKVNLANNPKFEILENNIKGEFKYISVVFKNQFTVSGRYKSGQYIWLSNKKGPKTIIKPSYLISTIKTFTSRGNY